MSVKGDWDPYNNLMELNSWVDRADEHLTNLLTNQKVIITTINELREELTHVQANIRLLETDLDDD
jgi:hypothetical protein|tara:strand:+ start:898 stop:1095 length:198 start_codon:yes stop_codon:yes gene_type:complete